MSTRKRSAFTVDFKLDTVMEGKRAFPGFVESCLSEVNQQNRALRAKRFINAHTP